MAIATQNPVTGEILQTFQALDDTQLEIVLQEMSATRIRWPATPIRTRLTCLRQVAQQLRRDNERFATLITLEMGKILREARAEVEKCALGCDYYADQAELFLADSLIHSDAGRSFVTYPPLGTLLAIMPWNFPFWQAFRAAIPAIAAGNTVLLKHASNVPQCALAIEEIFRNAFPEAVLRTLLITPQQAEALIADARVHAVTLTGSEAAGRRIAAAAGQHLKKCVLELGGSDAFVVLEDADLDASVEAAVASRFQNSGQSCIAAKRFIIVPKIAEEFLGAFERQLNELKLGDPMQPNTQQGPLARADLRERLHQQVIASIQLGAIPRMGCEPSTGPGYYYPVSLLDRVQAGMPAYEEELFGPVAAVLRAQNGDDALRLANDSRYGLGASVWTRDIERGETFARSIQSGQAFVNGLVRSDPRLPFGGIKASGFGRELSWLGIHEFVNSKTVWIK